MKTKTHILLIIWHPVGGIRTFLRYVYGQFSCEKYKLTILLPESSEINATREDFSDTNANFEVLPSKPSVFVFMANIVRVLAEQRIDIVHSQGFTSGVLAAIPAQFSRIPHILTSHDVLREDQFQGVKGKIKKMLIPLLLRMPDMIHSVSNDAQANLFAYFPLLKKMQQRNCVILNGIDTNRFSIEERADLKSEIGLSEKVFLIGFFGRFMPQKGFDVLVDAVEILAEQDCVPGFAVVAFGWGDYIREEQENIERRGLKEYFSFLPFEENVALALRGVDVVVMPSRWEACPLLPMEALVAGVPLIGTNCLGLREVLKNTPGKIVEVDNAQALAEAIKNEIEQSSLQQITAYRRQAAERFDVKTQVVALQELLGNLLYNKGH